MNPVEEDRALDGEGDPILDERRGREAMDPATRHLAMIAGGIAVLLAVVIGGWVLGGRHSGTVPVIEAAAGPVRVKPVDPGGMQALGAQAIAPVATGGGGEILAPSPEAPQPDALQAAVEAARRRDSATSLPAAGPGVQPPVVDGGGNGAAHGTRSSDGATETRSPEARSAAPTEDFQAPHPIPLPETSRPGPYGDPASRPLHTEAAPRPEGGLAVQLAALASHKAAQTEWSRLQRSHPRLFSGRSAEVEQIDRDGRAFYRLRTRGFASTAEAASFCQQARAQHVACAVADF